MMMLDGYPNLELLEYKSKNILQKIDNEKNKNKLIKIKIN